MKTTANHTPGPWKADKNLNPNYSENWYVEIRHSGYKEVICSHVGGMPDHPGGKDFQGTKEANARLIAAAPEMLEVLERTLNLAIGHACEARKIDASECENWSWVQKARNVIAKAKGE